MGSIQNLPVKGSELLPEQSDRPVRRMVISNNQLMTEVTVLEERGPQLSPKLLPPAAL